MLTEKEISEIKARVESATKGPWVSFIEGRDHSSGNDFIMTGIVNGEDIWGENRGEDIELTGTTNADQDFIANARQDIPKLLEEIANLKLELSKFKNGS